MNSIEDVLTCAICTSTLINPVRLDPCDHYFCKECIDEWLKRNRICPVDRRHVIQTKPPDRLVLSILEKVQAEAIKNARLSTTRASSVEGGESSSAQIPSPQSPRNSSNLSRPPPAQHSFVGRFKGFFRSPPTTPSPMRETPVAQIPAVQIEPPRMGRSQSQEPAVSNQSLLFTQPQVSRSRSQQPVAGARLVLPETHVDSPLFDPSPQIGFLSIHPYDDHAPQIMISPAIEYSSPPASLPMLPTILADATTSPPEFSLVCNCCTIAYPHYHPFFKCTTCRDAQFCQDCHLSVAFIHNDQHKFVPIENGNDDDYSMIPDVEVAPRASNAGWRTVVIASRRRRCWW
ncbi:hypothetical protein BDR26DRAFT_121148 [Obelidium mucronatum]|nr:hypothetical protein BDR26DRAFT_121148 [Obelidium mucronatum]